MGDTINFDSWQMKPLLFGLITQVVLPFNNDTMNIEEGDVYGICFNSDEFRDYKLVVTNVTFTNLKKLSNKDISKNGFIYKPAFISFMKSFRNIGNDSIVKVDFELMEKKL